MNYIFFLVFESVYFICCYSTTNIMTSFIAHIIRQIYMNNQEKFMARLRRLKLYRANSQTMSYLLWFFTDTVRNNSIFFLLSSFGFFSFSLFFSTFFCFLFACVCFKKKVYILIHIRLCGRVSDKRNFTLPISENKSTFFWSKKKENNQHSSVFKVLRW